MISKESWKHLSAAIKAMRPEDFSQIWWIRWVNGVPYSGIDRQHQMLPAIRAQRAELSRDLGIAEGNLAAHFRCARTQGVARQMGERRPPSRATEGLRQLLHFLMYPNRSLAFRSLPNQDGASCEGNGAESNPGQTRMIEVSKGERINLTGRGGG